MKLILEVEGSDEAIGDILRELEGRHFGEGLTFWYLFLWKTRHEGKVSLKLNEKNIDINRMPLIEL